MTSGNPAFISKWLTTLPDEQAGFFNASPSPGQGMGLYKHYFNWARDTIEKIEEDLEGCEQKYRRLGLSYHIIPLDFRKNPSEDSPSTIEVPVYCPDGKILLFTKATPPSLHPGIRESLQSAFCFSGTREETEFFRLWYRVSSKLATARRLLDADDGTDAQRRSIWAQLTANCDSMTEMVESINERLEEISRRIQKVSTIIVKGISSSLSLRADLADANSREGIAYHYWISTFPEVDSGKVNVYKAAHVLRSMGTKASMNLKNESAV